jgi:hypothetical protein
MESTAQLEKELDNPERRSNSKVQQSYRLNILAARPGTCQWQASVRLPIVAAD